MMEEISSNRGGTKQLKNSYGTLVTGLDLFKCSIQKNTEKDSDLESAIQCYH